eukprot:TRINITY_DN3103_c1_g2_i1.p2 TRINITY_DN3103_c1_g2~~TRINITY_DN3103_c1_g2_i1.p2  ORF type:complete len:351 (-),score=48.67 TRINITY_DN3103_c1_g2_i1:432-1484(-)
MGEASENLPANDLPVAEQQDAGVAGGTTSDAAAAEREPEILLGRFQMLDRLGEGVHGSVFRARDIETENIVAVKRYHFEKESEEDSDGGVPMHILREVSLLRDFEHPNIVRLLDVVVTNNLEFNLIFEQAEVDLGNFLRGFYRRRERLPTNTLASFARQLIHGIFACHTRSILHRDLKPQNILIDHGTHLKICDFGLSRIIDLTRPRAYTHEVITIWYRAPEMFLGATLYGMEVDNWSMGCIIAEMIVGTPIFMGDSEFGMLMKIFEAMGTPTEETWPGVSKLPHWQTWFPNWPHKNKAEMVCRLHPELPEAALELFQGLLTMCPTRRMTSRKANNHRCFQSMEEASMHG